MCSVPVDSNRTVASEPRNSSHSQPCLMSTMVTKGESLRQSSPAPDTPPSENEDRMTLSRRGGLSVKSDKELITDPESPGRDGKNTDCHSNGDPEGDDDDDDEDDDDGGGGEAEDHSADESSLGPDESRDGKGPLIPPGSSILSGHGAFRLINNRHLGQRQHHRSMDESDSEDRPLDFTSRADQLDANENNSNRKRNLEEYFLPFKRLGLGQTKDTLDGNSNEDISIRDDPGSANSGDEMGEDNLPSKRKRKGVQSFSIDDILSHKTAELVRQQKRLHEQQQLQQQQFQSHNNPFNPVSVPQAIVRPWDIGSAAAVAAAAAAAAQMAAGKSEKDSHSRSMKTSTDGGSGMSSTDRRKSTGDSPLDALFQMASKTFEGLKAKSGKHTANQVTE